MLRTLCPYGPRHHNQPVTFLTLPSLLTYQPFKPSIFVTSLLFHSNIIYHIANLLDSSSTDRLRYRIRIINYLHQAIDRGCFARRLRPVLCCGTFADPRNHFASNHLHLQTSREYSSPSVVIMSAYYFGAQHHQAPPTSHNHHGGRSRRAPRLSASQNSHRQFRGVKSMKELTENASVTAFRVRFEAGRSFDLDDDLEFCPGLLTEDDVCLPINTRNHHHAMVMGHQTTMMIANDSMNSCILFTLRRPIAHPCQAARPNRLPFNTKSSQPHKSHLASLCRPPQPVHTTRTLAFRVPILPPSSRSINLLPSAPETQFRSSTRVPG